MAEAAGARGLILASASAARQTMLANAGLTFAVVPADLDEGALRRDFEAAHAGAGPERVAEMLAVAKAEAVSRDNPEALVIGSDQVLAFEGEIFEKPRDMADARRCLQRLRGRTHHLHSAVALAGEGRAVWMHCDVARLKMRAFSDAALDAYLARTGDDVCRSVGAYMIEGPAVQLFEDVDGDTFTIMGMPLLALIGELTRRGVVQA